VNHLHISCNKKKANFTLILKLNKK